jgi:hypothetical protein
MSERDKALHDVQKALESLARAGQELYWSADARNERRIRRAIDVLVLVRESLEKTQ